MAVLMRIFPLWILMILFPGGSWGLHGPREVRGLVEGAVSLQCQYEKVYMGNKKYWCRGDIRLTCMILIETESNSHATKDRISIRDSSTELTFTVTMEHLTQEDNGKYWCGIHEPLLDPGDPVTLLVLPGLWGLSGPRKVKGYVGGSLSLKCSYGSDDKTRIKYWCRGKEWSSCDILVNTDTKRTCRISIWNDHAAFTFRVTMKNLTEADRGMYWCGIKAHLWDFGDPVIVTVLPDSANLVVDPALITEYFKEAQKTDLERTQAKDSFNVTKTESSTTTSQEYTHDAETTSEELGPTLCTPYNTPFGKNKTHVKGPLSSVTIFYMLTPVFILIVSAVIILIIIWRRRKAMKTEMSSGNENDTSSAQVTPRETEEISYSTVRFSANPHLENAVNTGPAQAKTSTEVTYAVVKAD